MLLIVWIHTHHETPPEKNTNRMRRTSYIKLEWAVMSYWLGDVMALSLINFCLSRLNKSWTLWNENLRSILRRKGSLILLFISKLSNKLIWFTLWNVLVFLIACSVFLIWSFTLMLKCMSAFWNNSSVLFTVKPTIRLAKMIPTNMMNRTRIICSDPLTLIFSLSFFVFSTFKAE